MKVGVTYVNVRISRHLKEELIWVIDKWLRVISSEMLFETVILLRNLIIYRIYPNRSPGVYFL